MTRYLTLDDVLALQLRVIEHSGGSSGVRDLGLVDSAVAQPRMTFDGADLFPTIVEKAAALGFSLVCNHAFVDGNKRIGHAAMETFLVLNGWEIAASVDEQERLILEVASGAIDRRQFTEWLKTHIVSRSA
jgi:death-on-curing protein